MTIFKTLSSVSLSFTLAAFVGVSVLGCGRETKNPKVQIRVVETGPAPEAAKVGQADTTAPLAAPSSIRPVTWALVNEKVIKPACAGCHSGAKPSAGLDLTSAAKFKESAGNNYAFVFFTEDPSLKMPLGGELTSEQKQILADYMVDGLQP